MTAGLERQECIHRRGGLARSRNRDGRFGRKRTFNLVAGNDRGWSKPAIMYQANGSICPISQVGFIPEVVAAEQHLSQKTRGSSWTWQLRRWLMDTLRRRKFGFFAFVGRDYAKMPSFQLGMSCPTNGGISR